MIVIDCEQGTEDWWQARIGIPTASDFDRIVTPPDYREKWDCKNKYCNKVHTSQKAASGCAPDGEAVKYIDVAMYQAQSYFSYRNKLLAEWLRGKPDDGFQSDWMKRGHEVEEEACDAYAFLCDAETVSVGFCKTDCERYGCSPDRLVGDDGGLEVKCPSPGVHVGYLLDNKIPTTYRLQVIGSLLVTGREYWDFISYHPDMEPLIIRTWRKDVEDELEKLAAALDKFCADLETSKQKLSKQLEQAA